MWFLMQLSQVFKLFCIIEHLFRLVSKFAGYGLDDRGLYGISLSLTFSDRSYRTTEGSGREYTSCITKTLIHKETTFHLLSLKSQKRVIKN